MPQQKSFTCVIEDHASQDRFSAEVSVSKRSVIRPSLLKSKIELADIYITPVSNQLFFYGSKANWKKTAATFPASTKERSGSHNHFVLYDFTGRGLYIVRDERRREVLRRDCSIWDLGQSFAGQVMKALKDFA